MTGRSKCRLWWVGIPVILAAPTLAHADAGVPMLALVLPGMAFSLLPIIAVETWYVRRVLKVPPKRSLLAMSLANLASTVGGVPLTWLGLVLAELSFLAFQGVLRFPSTAGRVLGVALYAAWLPPAESDYYWMVPVAALFLLVPFFFVSWWMEYGVAKRLLWEAELPQLRRAVKYANLISYGLLAAVLLIWLLRDTFFSTPQGPGGPGSA